MKKYPVIYKGKEYEVRWEEDTFSFLTIYEVKEIKIFKKIKFKEYIEKYYSFTSTVQELVTVSDDDPNYHIEEIKTLFKMWEELLSIENVIEKQEQSLEEWDGVIDG